MKQVAKAIAEKLISFFEKSSNQRVARELLKMTDAQLEDMGFSRNKLLKGAAGYPWKLVENTAPVLKFDKSTVSNSGTKVVADNPAPAEAA